VPYFENDPLLMLDLDISDDCDGGVHGANSFVVKEREFCDSDYETELLSEVFRREL
jgi:hypothetical protein